MKQNKFILPVLILIGGLLAVGSCKKDRTVALQVAGLSEQASGAMVFLHDVTDPDTAIDSATVADTTLVLDLSRLTEGGLYSVASSVSELNFVFVYEGQSLTYDARERSVSGSPANEAYHKFETELIALLEEENPDNLRTAQQKIKDFLGSQQNNPLSIRAARYATYVFDDITAIKPELDAMGSNVTRLPEYQSTMKIIDGLINTAPGKPFVDFAGVTDQGEAVKLSDYAARGQYVLADFWASWCGPCRREIPNLIKMHEQYKNKGLLVLGIGVWEKTKEDHLQAVADLKIPYPQIFDETQSTATDLYGIMGIPQIMLFGPDGTILHRNLRGDQLEEILGEIYK